jgi:hypothetical protein
MKIPVASNESQIHKKVEQEVHNNVMKSVRQNKGTSPLLDVWHITCMDIPQ